MRLELQSRFTREENKGTVMLNELPKVTLLKVSETITEPRNSARDLCNLPLHSHLCLSLNAIDKLAFLHVHIHSVNSCLSTWHGGDTNQLEYRYQETQALPSGAYGRLDGHRINNHTNRYLTGSGLRATKKILVIMRKQTDTISLTKYH